MDGEEVTRTRAGGGDAVAPRPALGRRVPILGAQKARDPAGAIGETGLREETIADPQVSDKTGTNLFGFYHRGPAMEPAFLGGDLVLVDPDQVPDPGDWVLADHNGEVVLRKYRPLDGKGFEFTLQPLNPDWPEIRTDLEDSVSLIGLVVEGGRLNLESQQPSP